VWHQNPTTTADPTTTEFPPDHMLVDPRQEGSQTAAAVVLRHQEVFSAKTIMQARAHMAQRDGSKKHHLTPVRTAANTPPPLHRRMAAQTTAELPASPEWVYNVKFDGYRALLMKAGDRIELRSRNDM